MIPSTQADLKSLLQELNELAKGKPKGEVVKLRIYETLVERMVYVVVAQVIRLGLEKVKSEGREGSPGFKQIVGYEYDELDREVWFVELFLTVE